MSRPNDLPNEELLRHANIVIQSFTDLGIKAEVYFKFTCANCGNRCALDQPNVLFEKGTCDKCGHLTHITEGGFLLKAEV
jgi:rRNA maturation endonuclease Nob1